ncbi:hypothetical protein ES703_111271 [subsurface metagenome]
MLAGGTLRNHDGEFKFPVVISFIITTGYFNLINVENYLYVFLFYKTHTFNLNLGAHCPLGRFHCNAGNDKLLFSQYLAFVSLGGIDKVITSNNLFCLITIGELIRYQERTSYIAPIPRRKGGTYCFYLFPNIEVINVIIHVGFLTGKVDIDSIP